MTPRTLTLYVLLFVSPNFAEDDPGTVSFART